MARKKSKRKEKVAEPQIKQNPKPAETSREWLPPLIIFVAALIVYWNTTSNQYAVDDFIIIQENKYVQEGFGGIGKIFSSDAFEGYYGDRGKSLVAGGRYRPLSIATFAIEYQLFGGLNPFMSHLINVILMGLTGAILFLLLKELLPPEKKPIWNGIAFMASLLYVLHPIHTEAVANIKGRDEIMGFLFSILSFYLVLKYLKLKQIKWLAFALTCFVLALFSKENAITFLAVIPLGLVLLKNENIAGAAKLTFPFILISGLFLLLRSRYAGSGEGTFELMNNPFILSSSSEKYGTILLTYLEYARLLIFPKVLSHDYYPFQIPKVGFGNPMVLVSLVMTLGVIVAGVYAVLKKRWPIVGFSIFYFLATFSVGSNLFFQIGTNMNERFLYMPSLGFVILLSMLIVKVGEKLKKDSKNQLNPIMLALLAVICMGYSYKTIDRNADWKNNLTLFAADAENSPNSAKVHLSYANSLVKEVTNNMGLPQIKKDSILDIAIQQLRMATDIYPDTTVVRNGKQIRIGYADAWACMGDAYFLKSQFDSAQFAYLQATVYRDRHFNAFVGLSLTMLNQNKYKEAIYYLRSVLTIEAANPIHWSRLGNAYFQTALNLQASATGADSAKFYSNQSIYAYQQAMQFDPVNAGDYHYEIGRNKARIQGDYAAAIQSFQLSLQSNPSMQSAREDLGITLMLSERYEEAVSQFQTLLSQDPNYLNARLNLGFTQLQASLTKLELGDYSSASSYASSAIETYQVVGQENPNAFIQARLGMGRASAEVFEQYDVAIGYFSEALGLDPNLGSSFQSFAAEAQERGDQKALNFYLSLLN